MQTETLSMRYKKAHLDVVSEFSVCKVCNEEFESPVQANANDISMREAKKEHDGLLGKDSLKRLRVQHKWTQQEAAIIFGGGINSFSKYERGEVSQSDSLDKLIRLCTSDTLILKKHLKLIDREDLFKLSAPKCKVVDFISDKSNTQRYSKKITSNNSVHRVIEPIEWQYGT
nr:type II TA system antitoxin MqsA family protein [Shewanella goraebulensis]